MLASGLDLSAGLDQDYLIVKAGSGRDLIKDRQKLSQAAPHDLIQFPILCTAARRIGP